MHRLQGRSELDKLTLAAQEFLWARENVQHLDWLRKRGLSDSTIKGAYLGYTPGAITIPYLNPPQRVDDSVTVRQIRRRNLFGHPKYETAKGDRPHIYNVEALSHHSQVWVCEGEFDALILQQMGKWAVGIPGAQLFRPEWKYLFVDCEHVSLVFDADEAGRGGGERIASMLGPVVTKMSIIRLPQGKDVTDMYLEDKMELHRLIS